MNNFEVLKNDKELNDLLDSINIVNKDSLFSCHGRKHTESVVNRVKYILISLGFNDSIVEMGMIAAILHDIGAIEGKEGHAYRSSVMCVKFLDKTSLLDEEKNIIINAIKNHGSSKFLDSPVHAALVLADKVDLTKDRVLKNGLKDNFTRNLLNIESVNISITDKEILINYVVNDQFSIEVFKEWSKAITEPINVCEYFNRKCVILFNNKNLL